MKRLVSITLMLACLTLVVAPAPPALALDKVSFRLNWILSGFHTVFYLGLERGYYRDEGIDLSIGEGQGSIRAVQVVAAGGDNIGLSDGSSVISGNARGADVMAFMGVMNKSPYTISARADSGVKKLKDLEGRIIAATAGEPGLPLLQAIWKVNGIDGGKVRILNVDGPGKIVAVLEKRADALLAGIENQVIILRHRGVEQVVFHYPDVGVNTLGLTIHAKREYVQKNPDLIRRFVRATIRSFQAAMENPEASVEAGMKVKPGVDRRLTLDQLKASLPLVYSLHDDRKRLGWMSPKDWEDTLSLMKEYMELRTDLAPTTLYSNAYLPYQ